MTTDDKNYLLYMLLVITITIQFLFVTWRFDDVEKQQIKLEAKLDTIQKQNLLIIDALGEIYSNTEEIKYGNN